MSLRMSLRKHAIQAPDKRRAGTKCQTVGEDREKNRDEARDGKAGHHRVTNVLLAHHAAVKQPEARYCHHQYKRDRREHPRSIAGIGCALFETLPPQTGGPAVLRERDVTECKTENRGPQESSHD